MLRALETIILQNKKNNEDKQQILEALALQTKKSKDELVEIKKFIKEYKPEKFPEIKDADFTATNKILEEIKKDLNQEQKVNITLNLI